MAWQGSKIKWCPCWVCTTRRWDEIGSRVCCGMLWLGTAEIRDGCTIAIQCFGLFQVAIDTRFTWNILKRRTFWNLASSEIIPCYLVSIQQISVSISNSAPPTIPWRNSGEFGLRTCREMTFPMHILQKGLRINILSATASHEADRWGIGVDGEILYAEVTSYQGVFVWDIPKTLRFLRPFEAYIDLAHAVCTPPVELVGPQVLLIGRWVRSFSLPNMAEYCNTIWPRKRRVAKVCCRIWVFPQMGLPNNGWFLNL